ncbi:MAG: hypothetical protein L3J49_01335 [Desulfobulbaceae bacterium]|nr:hypothetical protein [Desulfobulbaceae bacterium]
MACLVEGRCSVKEQQRFFEHLAGCKRCYGQWLELHEIEAGEQKGSNKKSRFFKIKNLAWAGSAFAAAASVVLYLNIIRDAGQPLYKTQVQEEKRIERTDVLQMNEMPGEDKAGRADVPQVEKTFAAPASPEKKRSRQAVRSKKAERQADAGGMGLSGSAEQNVMLMESAPVLEEGGVQVQRAPEPVKSPLTLELWLATVRQGCLRKEQNAGFWQRQSIAGHQLMQRTKEGGAGFTEEQQNRQVADVLKRVDTLAGGESSGNLCGEIENILRE